MPESLKQEVLHYAKYLIENYSKDKDISQEQYPVKKTSFRYLKRNVCFTIA
ncbi:DUF2281 domain-containing protein [Okeania sp. SIO3I5]|uniref:DUF2281 domain-containing protein n=1 Tax=Okeania sp. SIO3I5 TaxID=2607805 RepID=UPI0025CE5E15|nr:DUF2281 domain-containing protein [Okeania sp. SIO3I5]